MSFTSTLFRTAVLAALGTLALASQPVIVSMQDGSQIKGTFVDGSADEIKVVVAGQTLTLKTANIEALKFDSGPAANPTQAFTPINPVPATPAAHSQGRPFPPILLLSSASSIRPIPATTLWARNTVLLSTNRCLIRLEKLWPRAAPMC